MKKIGTMQTFLLTNPFYRGMAEWLILIGTGVCGLMLSWPRFDIFPITTIVGGLLILLSFAFHYRTEKDHQQAHRETSEVDEIVTTGVYGRIRHPLYLSLIFLNLGIALAFGVSITVILALLTSVHWMATALAEEKMLLARFPNEYSHYRQVVRWRMIPGIF